jgi:hypothetical protein
MSISRMFICLQLLDFVTTIVGFRLGAGEASPFIRILMHAGPVTGVALSKALALGMGALCAYTGRQHLIRKANYWYGGLGVWNMLVILAAHSAF